MPVITPGDISARLGSPFNNLASPFNPSLISGLALWLDAGLGAKTGGAGQFTAANTESLSVADNASLDVTGSFSVTGWIYMDTVGASNTVIAQYDAIGNQRSWWLRHIGGTGFRFVTAQTGTGGGLVTLDSSGALAGLTWHFFHIYFNSATGKVGIQVNAGAPVEATQASIHNSTGALEVGARNATDLFDGRISRLSLWANTVLSAAQVTWLYNSGTGRTYEDFGNASNDGANLKKNLVSYWKLGEVSGTRADSHGSNDLTDNNTVTWAEGPSLIDAYDGAIVRLLDDRSVSNIDPALVSSTTAPTFEAGEINGQPVIRFDGTDDHLKVSSAPAALNTAEGSIFALIKPAAIVAGQHAIISSADEAATGNFFFGLTDSTFDRLLIRQGGNQVLGSSTLSLSTWYLVEYHSDGAAWSMVLNGVAETVSVLTGSNDGNWFSDVADRDNLIIGAIQTSAGVARYFSGDMIPPIVYSRNLTAAERVQVRRYFNRKYSLGLAV